MKKDDPLDPVYYAGAQILDGMSKDRSYSIWMRLIFAIISVCILANNGWLQGFESCGEGIGEEI